MCYYGFGRIKDLSKFDLVIIEAANYTPREINYIRKNGTKVLGYISLGEDDILHEGNGEGPGGYASWYLDYFRDEGLENSGEDRKPDKNAQWQTYYVNPLDPLWQEYIVDVKVDFLINKLGCDGLFLDTVLYPDRYPETVKENFLHPGVEVLIKNIRKRYPKIILILNNGWIFLEELKLKIDGIVFEDFSCLFDKLPSEQLQYNSIQANKINSFRSRYGKVYFPVFSLDYVDKEGLDLINFSYQRAKDFDFIPSVSGKDEEGRYLTVIFMVNPANDLVALRRDNKVRLSWEINPQYVEESQAEFYVIKRSSHPIITERDWEKASLVSDKIPAEQNYFEDKISPKEIKYYALQGVRKGNLQLIGRLCAKVEEEPASGNE